MRGKAWLSTPAGREWAALGKQIFKLGDRIQHIHSKEVGTLIDLRPPMAHKDSHDVLFDGAESLHDAITVPKHAMIRIGPGGLWAWDV